MNARFVLPIVACTLASACSTTHNFAAQDGSARSDSSAWTRRLNDPVTAPTTFESPTIQTNLNAIVMHHGLPKSSIFGGGDVNIYALQARYAVNDRLALIATKDGYIDLNPNVGANQEGWADIAGGFKYAVINDPDGNFLLTPGLIYETKSGDTEVFQGNGDGVIRPFVSGGWDLDALNVLGSFGYNHPIDGDDETASFDYHIHVDYAATENLFPLWELNGIKYTSNANALPVNFEGGDLINLGAANVAGNSVITSALGARYRLNDSFTFGLAYEWPITSREDIIDDRITFDVLLGF